MDRKILADGLRGREVRRAPASSLEVRETNGTLTMEGIASVTERSYDMGWYQETIKRGAFAKTLSEGPDVQLLLNHEGLPLARTTSGTLQLSEVDAGLRAVATLNPDDPDVQRLLPKVERGDIDQMSFAFRVVRQEWDEDRENRAISEVSLDRGDVSIVNYGANPATSFNVTARQLVDALVEIRTYRAGAALSTATMSALKSILNLVDAADTGVDKALMELSDLMGVTNPDVAQDAALERAAEVEALSNLDTYMARAYALRLRG